ncbi:Dynamin-binding protein [Colletotrichum higginsianum]|uniref:Dynamin-binding protein n=1 Tax=Colletotrichum higginsianum TaxID=80884 RepID=A0A4T0WEC9_9PEZI|nr:Dynamin-binding protein [Colletotrichum higginsianum]
MKTIDRSKSPQKRVPRQPSKLDELTTRRRKISIGPIDFEQRREHIRLAYTKSIRDSQVRDARQAAARRNKDQESVATKENEDVPPVPPIESKAPSVDHCEPFEKPNEENPDKPESSAQPTSPEQSPQPLSILTAVPPIVSLSPPQAQPADSPTLGMPGTFPEPSPSVEREEIPQSAVSATSETTEFDNEPQEMPPVQLEPSHPPTGLGLTIAQPGGNHEQAEMEELRRTTSPENPEVEKPQPPPTPEETAAESSDEQPTPQAAVAEEAQQSPTPEKAEYQYPFEDESAGGDDLVSIKISLDATSPRQSLEPTPTRSDFEDTSVPGAFASSRPISKEYEPVPFSSPSYETTVKILRRESEYDSPRQEETIPFPRMESYDDFDDQSQLGDMDGSVCDVPYFHRNPEEEQDVGAPSSDTLEKPEDFYNERRKDNDSSQRASTCESSDAQDDPHKTSLESQQTPDTSHSLMVPSMHVTVNRVSQQSAWTDFSVDSNEPLDHRDSAFDDALPLPKPPYASDPTYGSGSSRDSSARQSEHYSPDFTPLDSGATQQISRATIHQLPELDTGEGFSISYLESKQPLVKSGSFSRPDHEPPPVPTPKSRSLHEGRRTATSSYYADTISGSIMARSSWRESEDVSRPVSTTQSIDHMSIETREYSLGGQTPIDSIATPGKDNDGPTGKERHRLVQRRNVIRELVDTEMVFVRDMNIVEEIYKGTAEACPRLDDKTIKLVFRNTDEIISFHTTFCAQLKEAASTVYVPHGRRSPLPKEDSTASDQAGNSSTNPANPELGDDKDRATSIGPLFKRNIEQMRLAHEGFLRNSDHAAKRLIQIQQDPTVKVWLTECNEVAKDLTAAWDLDSLLIKPMQRITKYPTLIQELLRHTPEDHPDRAELVSAKETLELAIIEINKTKKNFELVGQIVGRKRKESDVKAGFARAFGKRVDKLQATSSKIPEDAVYAKLHEKFGDDYLRLQVVLRDVEFYTRQVSAYVHEFLQYLSAMELVMRLQPGSYPELESKWVQFNVSMRDIEKIALEDHLQQVRKHVIEPFEHVIKAYGNPSLAMKKRAKRRLDYERAEQLKKGGKTPDPRLKELVEQYDALNETLKKELPQLSALTERIGNICLGNFVNIQANWYSIWVEKVKKVTGDMGPPPDVPDIVSTFQRDYKYAQELFTNIGILNPTYKGRTSQSTTASTEDAPPKHRARPAEVSSPRGRGLSVNGDHAPMLPTPDFAKRHSGQFTLSPSTTPLSPHQFYYRDYYTASLFEFNIETTKHEAGYPYLTYQAGEIFDVIAEKGELWLAKNQDDPDDQVGWIWSKHFAKLADS